MELFLDIIRIYHANIIKPIFASVLTVVIVQKLFSQLPLNYALALLRLVIVTYGIFSVASAILSFITLNTSFERATGPYGFAYVIMLLSACVLPFLVLHKKLKRNIYFLLILSLLINIGWLFEFHVISITSLHRDYIGELPEGAWGYIADILYVFSILALQGFILGLLSILMGNLVFRFSKKNNFANHLIKTKV